jgi:peptide/nickel transport system permease protein
MKRYLFEHVAQGMLGLLFLSFLVFVSAHATGNPALYLVPPEHSTVDDLERAERLLGLDRPLIVQYGDFLAGALQGDFGISIRYARPVSELLAERLPATVELAVVALVVAVLVGLPLGVLAAIKRNSVLDRVLQSFAIFSMSAPQFWVGIMLVTLFAGYLRWLPAFGRGEPAHLVLPVATLTLFLFAGMMRLTYSSMLEVMESDFVRFGRMRGLSPRRVMWKHALKNALIPVITFTGIMLAALLNGTIVVEQVFGWPGIGQLTLEAVLQRDIPLLQGAVLLSGFFFIVCSILVDVAYALVDPRLRRG